MIRTLRSLLPALALAFAPMLHAQMAYVPGHILVMMQPGADPHKVALDLSTVDGTPTGIRVEREVSAPLRAWLLTYEPATLPQSRMLGLVARHQAVQLAQNDHIITERNVPDDAQYGQQWHHQNIDSETAWQYTTGGVTATGDTIVVCIIERADLPHPDLIDNAWYNHQEIPGNGIDDDGNGYVDDHRGWNPANNTDGVYGGGHGTQVAGMIGAKGNNSLGVAGANWNVKMMVVNYANAQESNVLAAYTYPLVMRRRYNESNGATGAFVVATNASWGIDGGQPSNAPLWCAMYDTLGTAGVLSCGATANNNVNVDAVGDLPTACPSPYMVSVTATNNSDVRTFSAYGATTIDVGAPGEQVRTTSIGGGYGNTSGTSFASPLTAGVIGLLYSAPCPTMMDLVRSDPETGAMYIRQVLFDGVEQVGNLPGNTVTGGRINAGNSMQLIMAACGDCPAPYAASVSVSSEDEANYSWNSLGEGVFTVRFRPVGGTEWTVVEGISENNFLAQGIDPCVAYEFQVMVECEEEESGFSTSSLLLPETVTVPSISFDGFPVICEGSSLTLTSSSVAGNLWSTGGTSQSIEATEPGIYSVTVSNPCSEETSAPVTLEIFSAPVPQAGDVVIPEPGVATLTADGPGIQWYDAPMGGNLLGAGNSWQTPFLDENTTFWASSVAPSGGPGVFGGRTDRDAGNGQFHTNGSFWQVFTATESFTIRSVKVYANGSGNRTIGLVNMANNATIVEGVFNIPTGEQRVQLDFEVPGPGNYGLRIMSGNPQLWRDGLGSNPSYPYPLGQYGAVTSSSVTGQNSTGYWYFFYDWHVGPASVDCESERTEVNVTILTLGISDRESAQVSVFPIPADQELYIEVAGSAHQRSLHMLVRDASGRVVDNAALREGRNTLHTARLAAGMYMFSIVADDRVVKHGRFIVAH